MPILSESRFNAYNQLSVVTLMMILGFNINDILKNMSKLKIAETRYEKIKLKNNKYLIKHLTKGQNPLACSNVFDFVRNYEGKKNVILMLDDKSDNEEGVEVILWHYDADYEFLNDDRFNFMDRLEFTFGYMVKIMEYITQNNYNPPYNFNELKNDRDKLELVIEQYKFAKYLLSGDKRGYAEYLEDLEQYEVFSKDKAIMTMIDYKLARFSDEIFQEMGVKIIDRLDNGAVILQDIGLYKN